MTITLRVPWVLAAIAALVAVGIALTWMPREARSAADGAGVPAAQPNAAATLVEPRTLAEERRVPQGATTEPAAPLPATVAEPSVSERAEVLASEAGRLLPRMLALDASFDDVLELALDLVEAASSVTPVVDGASGDRRYQLLDDSTLGRITVVAGGATPPRPDPIQQIRVGTRASSASDPFRLTIELPDAPGFQAPTDRVGGAKLAIHFNTDDQGLSRVTTHAQVEIVQDRVALDHFAGAGPVDVGAVLTVGREYAGWSKVTMEWFEFEGAPGWKMATAPEGEASATLADPRVARLHERLIALRGGE